MTTYRMTNQKQIRAEFWGEFPEFADLRKPGGQNAQLADVRMAFVDYVDQLERSGAISPALAGRVTL